MSAPLKRVLTVAALGLTGAVLAPTTAHADPVNFQGCNLSNSNAYIAFPYHDWLESPVLAPGQCWQTSVSGLSPDEVVWYGDVNGFYAVKLAHYFNDSAPWTEIDLTSTDGE